MDFRNILHFDLDMFFVAVELKKNAALIGKPVIIGGGERGVVASCSYEARKYGVRSAMPIRTAKFLCPDAKIISGDYEDYSKESQIVTEAIASKVPLFEKASIDEFYIDMTGMDKFFGCYKYSLEIRDFLTRETGLPISLALASNKLISKVATNEVKPKGQISIDWGEERVYLAPLKIEKLPGIGEKTAFILNRMGVKVIQVLAGIPEEMLIARFGKNGSEISRRAKGIDESPVIPYSEQKSISTQETFINDTIDIRFLEKEIVRMTEKIGFELRQQNKLTGCITVKIRYSDFNTVTKQAVIPYTNADHVLLELAKQLFDKLYERRLLVRLIGVRFSNLVYGTQQINLFDDTQEMIALYQAIDSIKTRFGVEKILRARGL